MHKKLCRNEAGGKKMKHSIRLKITLALVLSLASAIFLCWILNKGFLEDYYQYSKIKALDAAYDELTTVFEEYANSSKTEESQKNQRREGSVYITVFSNEMQEKLEEISIKNNVNLYIYQGYTMIFRTGIAREAERVTKALGLYLLDPILFPGQTMHLKSETGYDIYKLYDGGKENCYIDLIGVLGNQSFVVFLRSNFESIQESAAVANKFLTYVGIITVIAGAAVMFLISRSFSKPILELASIAKRMSHLDFDATYPVKSQDEIGELGNSINILSKKLETTISELKKVNNELQSDIQNKIQIDEMRKEFLSNVTHELKTPIALIQGYAEGLQENINDDPESREFYCEVIVDEAMKMNKMVKKLLSLNQIEFGTNQVNMERFDLTALICSVLASTDILMKQKEITVLFQTVEPVYVWADEYMIEEVVTNYISNAINHADRAKMIEIRLILRGDIVRTAVFNTGEKIPEEDLEKVWIKFYKVDKARTREYGGSGIGLSIVKAIMDAHNKECGVVNHDNGVEFWFELDAGAAIEEKPND